MEGYGALQFFTEEKTNRSCRLAPRHRNRSPARLRPAFVWPSAFGQGMSVVAQEVGVVSSCAFSKRELQAPNR